MTERQHLRFCTSSDGVALAYAAVGHGPPLVKTANWLTHLEYDWESPIWRPWIEALARNRTYVRYDTRGCGLADREPADVSLEGWVRDLEAVVDAAGLERFPLLGISQGGPIAIAYAVRHPERVSHLVFYGSFLRGRLKRGGGPEKIEQALLYYKLTELGWGSDNPSFRAVFANDFLPGGSQEMLRAFDELQRVSSSGAFAVRFMQASDQLDVADMARRVKCPTLVMHSRGDRRVPFEEGRLVAAHIPGARFVPLESDNHVLLATEPAWPRFLEELDAFLPRGAAGRFAELTARERALVELLARGLDNHQIAAHLAVTEKTVRNMVSTVFDKLDVDSRAQAIVRAREAGFGVEAG
jgi:pimeloyl-ACP methyl ester carboxylesterase/DNA-binding CsgD family transcriptional regulator